MKIAWIELKRDEFPWKFLNWQHIHRHPHLMTENSARERSISILRRRYGYNREEAIYQLDKYYSRASLG